MAAITKKRMDKKFFRELRRSKGVEVEAPRGSKVSRVARKVFNTAGLCVICKTATEAFENRK